MLTYQNCSPSKSSAQIIWELRIRTREDSGEPVVEVITFSAVEDGDFLLLNGPELGPHACGTGARLVQA